MTRNDAVEVRRQRIQAVNQMFVAALYKNKDIGWVSLDVTLANIEYETGLRQERILEYASDGEKRGLFKIDVKDNKILKVKVSE